MDLVEFGDKLFNERSVEVYVTYILLVAFRLLDHLWLQQQKLLIAHLELEVLAHQIAQICPNADLHRERHRGNGVVVYNKVLLHQ